jgi:hypothetical protein
VKSLTLEPGSMLKLLSFKEKVKSTS